MPRYDYTSMGFYTFDCLGWPFTEVPAGGGTVFIDDLTLAVSGAAGTAAIAAAKMGINTLAVGGVGEDIMADWVLARLKHFGVDTWGMQQKPGWKTSSSIVTTRADGSREYAPPFKLGGHRFEVTREAPAHGEHSAEILREAGYEGAFRSVEEGVAEYVRELLKA